MDNVNDIIDMLKDRLVEATRKENRIKDDVYNSVEPCNTFADLIEAEGLADQLRSILTAITGEELYWDEDGQEFYKITR